MYSSSIHLASNYSTTEELNKILDSIDYKIVELGIVALNNYRFGFDVKVNLDLYQDLLQYKKILTRKLLGCNCLQDVLLIKIISKIKKLIR